MRVLAIVLLIAFFIAQVALNLQHIKFSRYFSVGFHLHPKVAARDLSKYKPRGVLYPRAPLKSKKPIVPVKHTATINTRGR